MPFLVRFSPEAVIQVSASDRFQLVCEVLVIIGELQQGLLDISCFLIGCADAEFFRMQAVSRGRLDLVRQQTFPLVARAKVYVPRAM